MDAADTESYLQQVASACGDSFRDIVKYYLEMDAESRPEDSGTASRLENATELDLVEKLEHVAEAV